MLQGRTKLELGKMNMSIKEYHRVVPKFCPSCGHSLMGYYIETEITEDIIYPEAVLFVQHFKVITESTLARKFNIGHARAMHIIDLLVEDKYILPIDKKQGWRVCETLSDSTFAPATNKMEEAPLDYCPECGHNLAKYRYEVISDDIELYLQAVQYAKKTGKMSAALLQRKFKIGYAHAARLVDRMEENRIIGPADGSNPREVFDKE